MYIEKTGMIDYGLMEQHFTDEELLYHHLYLMEKQTERCKESSQKLDKHIDTFCSIIDLTSKLSSAYKCKRDGTACLMGGWVDGSMHSAKSINHQFMNMNNRFEYGTPQRSQIH